VLFEPFCPVDSSFYCILLFYILLIVSVSTNKYIKKYDYWATESVSSALSARSHMEARDHANTDNTHTHNTLWLCLLHQWRQRERSRWQEYCAWNVIIVSRTKICTHCAFSVHTMVTCETVPDQLVLFAPDRATVETSEAYQLDLSNLSCSRGWCSVLHDYHPSVLLHCWLGHLPCKIVSEMTYDVSSGTLNPTVTYQLYWTHV